MSVEIERKFLVRTDVDWIGKTVGSTEIAQAYLSADPDRTIRVRIYAGKAFITVKSRTIGMSRNEWEYEIPVSDAREMMSLPNLPVIYKTRYYIPSGGYTWEIDVFGGRLQGLVVAEVELPAEDVELDIPDFIGKEVTGDPRYYNSMLLTSEWPFVTD